MPLLAGYGRFYLQPSRWVGICGISSICKAYIKSFSRNQVYLAVFWPTPATTYILKTSTNHTPGALLLTRLTSYLIWGRKARVNVVLSTLSGFQLILANFELIRQPIRTCFFSAYVCVCGLSVAILAAERTKTPTPQEQTPK